MMACNAYAWYDADMTISRYITVNPAVCHGQPCFRGTRVRVSDVLTLLANGESVEEIVKHAYPQLKPAQIRAAIAVAADMLGSGSVLPLTHAVAHR